MNETRKDSTAINIFTVIAILLIIGIPIYGYFKLKPDRIFDIEDNQPEVVDTTTEDSITESHEEKKEQKVITGYTRELVEIDDQWTYILAPDPIDLEYPSRLVIYNHGSITFVEENMDEDFEQTLIKYGEALTPYNYIFAVSNAHGVNWGSLESVNDNYKMYEYIKDKYVIQDEVYIIGFSMGGLPAMNFATEYPELVSKIALLAPSTRTNEWDQERVNTLKNIDIQIWHGTEDINVGYVYTQGFVNKLESLGKEINFITLEDKDHWDLDAEYIDQILEFFNSSETFSD
jgi:fermentation-respiration switch protein FrsA (DUF1100 family)